MTNINGIWLGTYWQRGSPTRFEMSIIQGQNMIVGSILDQSNLGEASIKGEVIGKTVHFRKTYVTGSRHSISYIGTIANNLNLMQGTWQEDYFNDGIWEATRQEDNWLMDTNQVNKKI